MAHTISLGSFWRNTRWDISYAARALIRTPAFTAIAIVTLALGIGANSAIFSVVNAVLLRPLPYHEADRLVFLWSTGPGGDAQPLTPGRFLDFREQMASIGEMAGICQFGVVLTGGGVPELIDASSVSSNFFDVLGARPLLGEPFHSGAVDERAVVLSHGLWTRRFGADRSIVGREIVLNGKTRRVIAVMDRDFGWPAITARPSLASGPELWMPGAVRDIPRTPADSASENLAGNRSLGILRAVGRVRPGATIEQTQREAEMVAERLATTYPATDGERGARVVLLRHQFFGPVTQPLLVLLGAVGFVLAIACANVASLLLGRATSRRREMAIRLALGASRRRIVQQLLIESVVLSLAGGLAGLAVAGWASAWLVRMQAGSVVSVPAVGLDARVLLFTLAVAVFTGIAFGLAPALQAAGGAVNEALKDGGTRGSSGPAARRTCDLLVIAEIAVALVLLVGAGLLVRSFDALSRVDNGLDPRNLLTFAASASRDRASTPAARAAFHDELLRRVRVLPGVVRAGAAVTLPIGGDDFSAPYLVEGSPTPAAGREPSAGYQVVTPGYFAAIGMRIVVGRDFVSSDLAESPPVVMVNEALARNAWNGRDPLGRRLRLGADEPWLAVVGVVSDVRHRGPAAPPRPELYQPLAQRPFASMAFVVRTTTDLAALAPLVRAEAASLDPMLPLSKVSTMTEHIERAMSRPRFMSVLVTAFGALAVALALVGIYGVMSYSVAERTRELAIRSALGAPPGDVMRLVLGRAAVLAGGGIVAGAGGALLVTRALGGLLFGVEPTDAPTFVVASSVLAIVALLAAAAPAIRATRVSGAELLR